MTKYRVLYSWYAPATDTWHWDVRTLHSARGLWALCAYADTLAPTVFPGGSTHHSTEVEVLS